MAHWNNLKTAIANVIKTNGNQEITGRLLQNVLNNIVSSVGENATFAGVATPTTNPGTPDGPVFYLASENGIYTNFNSIVLNDEVVLLINNNNVWQKVDTGIATSKKVKELSDNMIGLSNTTNYVEGIKTSYTKINKDGTLGSGVYTVYSYPIVKDKIYEIYSNMLTPPNSSFARAVLSKGTNPVKVLALGDGTTNVYKETFKVDVDANTLYVLSYKSSVPKFGNVIEPGLFYRVKENENSIEELNENQTKIESDIENGGLKEKKDEIQNTLTEYTSINSNGVLGTSVWKVYSFVVEKNKYYNVYSNMLTPPKSSFARAVLSKGTNPVKVLALGDGTTNVYEETFKVDVDADTLYVLSYLSSVPKCYELELSLKDDVANIKEDINTIKNNIGDVLNLNTKDKSNLVSAINEVSEETNSLIMKNSYTEIITKKYEDITWQDGWWAGTGIAQSSKHTSPIEVKNGDMLIFNTKSVNSSKESILVLVDELNTSPAIKILLQATSNDFAQYQYQMEEDGYVSIGGYFTSTQQRQQFQLTIVRFNNLTKLYEKTTENTNDIEFINSSDDLKLSQITDNPLQKIRYEAGMTSIFNTWGFVADSLGSGETAVRVFGEIKRKDLYEYSWGQKLCKICGVDGYNYSYGGQTAKRWIEDKSSERAWGYAKTTPKQAYIIALGVNDLVHIEQGEYTVGNVNTDIGTYNPEDDTDTNANSFVGYYAGIIQRLKSVSPRCRIFCSTIPNGVGKLDSLNEAIREIVGKFDNLYLVDIKKYNTNKKVYNSSSGTYLNDHYSALGYLLIAYMYCTYIDWIIRKNAMEFIDVARIMYSDEEIRDNWTL